MSVIGINGKINSGKDTIGKIIQYLTANEEVKKITTLEEWLDSDDLNGRDFNWKIKKYAGKLKQTASLLTGIPIEMFEDQEFKKTALGPQWNYNDIIGYGHHNVPVYGESEQEMLVRELLQKLGTEAMRDGLHTNVWVNALFADYTPTHYAVGAFDTKLTDGIPFYPNWIITDMRFPNEMDAVVERKGITIRVVRPEMHSLQAMVPAHASETAIDNAKFDYEIINDGTIEDLVEKVKEILTIEKLI
jgi:hypothetical protein